MVCDDADIAAGIRDLLSEHLVADEQALGFSVTGDEAEGGLYVVTDRSGFVLARVRARPHAVAIIASHLGVLAPLPSGTVRLRLRAVVSQEATAVLVAPPLFMAPAAVERRLQSMGWRLVDRVAVDVDAATSVIRLTAPQWHQADADSQVPGHVDFADGSAPVRALLVPALPHLGEPTGAQLVSLYLATMASGSNRSERLDAAEELASTVEVKMVPLGDAAAPYRALSEL